MLKFNPHKSNCMGCAACYSACPVKCIVMRPDEEGFLYLAKETDYDENGELVSEISYDADGNEICD